MRSTRPEDETTGSSDCAEKGELISQGEQRQLMQWAIPSRDYTAQDLNLLKAG